MTISEILKMSDMEISKLKAPELRKLTTQLASASNKRLARFEKQSKSGNPVKVTNTKGGKKTTYTIHDLTQSPAYQKAQKRAYTTKQGGKFGTGHIKKGTKYELNKLREEFSANKRFLQSETSTVAGYTKVQQVAYDRMGITGFSSEEREKQFWKAYRESVEMGALTDTSKKGSTELQVQLVKIYTKGTPVRNDYLQKINETNNKLLGYNFTPEQIRKMTQNHQIIYGDATRGIEQLNYKNREDNVVLISEYAHIQYQTYQINSRRPTTDNTDFFEL